LYKKKILSTNDAPLSTYDGRKKYIICSHSGTSRKAMAKKNKGTKNRPELLPGKSNHKKRKLHQSKDDYQNTALNNREGGVSKKKEKRDTVTERLGGTAKNEGGGTTRGWVGG